MTFAEIAVFMFCMIGCGMSCWSLGFKDGRSDLIEHFIDIGVLEIEFEDDEDEQ